MVTIVFKLEKETKNTIRYEAKAASNESGMMHPPVTTIYVGKFAFNGKTPPPELTFVTTDL